MSDALPCPTCASPVKVLGERLGSEIRCPSCGQPLLVALQDGAIVVIARAAPAPMTQPRPERTRKARRLDSLLPVLVPLAAVGVIVIAIAIRVIRESSGHKRPAAAEIAARENGALKSLMKPDHGAPKKEKQNAKPTSRSVPPPEPEAAPTPRRKRNLLDDPDPAPKDGGADLPDKAIPRNAERSRFDPPPVIIDPFVKLREAKKEFRLAIAADLERIVAECEEIVKERAAKTGDPSAIKPLVNEIEALKRDGTMPTSADFESQRKSHLEMRKAADRELYAAYQSTVAELTKALQVDEALSVKAEMGEFVQKERECLAIATSESKTEPKETTAKPEPVEKVRGFDFAQFLGRFVDEVERVAEFETGAKRTEEHKKMMDKMDDMLRLHTLRFHFPIIEVTGNGAGFTAHLSPPDEAEKIKGVTFMDSYKLDAPLARRATEFRPGDVLELSGKPRLAVRGAAEYRPGPRLINFASIHFNSRWGTLGYEFYLQNYDALIRKKRDRETASPDDEQDGDSLPKALRPVNK